MLALGLSTPFILEIVHMPVQTLLADKIVGRVVDTSTCGGVLALYICTKQLNPENSVPRKSKLERSTVATKKFKG